MDKMIAAVETVGYYGWLIAFKIHRADLRVKGKSISETDRLGSSKVALVSMDKSLKAWIVLYELIPVYQDEILKIMAHLTRLRTLLETEFPEARSFIRPGLDE